VNRKRNHPIAGRDSRPPRNILFDRVNFHDSNVMAGLAGGLPELRDYRFLPGRR